MFGSSILEIVIGLVFIYFIMSLLCSALNEWIARIFAMRAKTLEAGILRLLSEDKNLKEKIYEHPLVNGLSRKGWWESKLAAKAAKDKSNQQPQGERNQQHQDESKKKQPLLSKIPILNKTSSPGPSNLTARRFALVLLDTLMEAGRKKRIEKGEAVSDAFTESLDTTDKDKSKELQLTAKKEMLRDLQEGIEDQSPDVKRVLKGILDSVKAQVDQWDTAVTAFRVSIESWFDDTMDRVSGWYNRKAKLIILCLAVAVSFALNVDTIVIANTLSQDATLRASVVAAAEVRAQQATPEDGELDTTLGVDKYREELSALALPILWSTEDGDPRSAPGNFSGWVVKLLGLLITAFAVALGAPFWFDLLSKFVNVRTSGRQPAKTSEVGPAESTASSRT